MSYARLCILDTNYANRDNTTAKHLKGGVLSLYEVLIVAGVNQAYIALKNYVFKIQNRFNSYQFYINDIYFNIDIFYL